METPKPTEFYPKQKYPCPQWRTATGNAATVVTATFYVVKDNKAEKIRG
jgi:hypothetical protein